MRACGRRRRKDGQVYNDDMPVLEDGRACSNARRRRFGRNTDLRAVENIKRYSYRLKAGRKRESNQTRQASFVGHRDGNRFSIFSVETILIRTPIPVKSAIRSFTTQLYNDNARSRIAYPKRLRKKRVSKVIFFLTTATTLI